LTWAASRPGGVAIFERFRQFEEAAHQPDDIADMFLEEGLLVDAKAAASTLWDYVRSADSPC
jgi:hypothetical protein